MSFDDIRALAHPVLRHRVLTNFRAESEGITTDSIIDELLTRGAGAEERDVEQTGTAELAEIAEKNIYSAILCELRG